MPVDGTLSRSRSRGRPSHHANSSQSAFRNPWPSGGIPTWNEISQMSLPINWSADLTNNPNAQTVEIVVPDWGAKVDRDAKNPNDCIVGTWLGHASAMVQLPVQGGFREGNELQRKSLWVLFDPIFSSRAGPTQYTGPKRLKPAPCEVINLPACDAVVISHNHYDHLDLTSIQSIFKKFPKCRYFFPLGNKTWFTALGIPDELLHEKDWWQDCTLQPMDFGFKSLEEASDLEEIRFTALPAQHTSGRGVLDQTSTLWCGWIIEKVISSRNHECKERKGAVYYAGDTGLRRTSRSEDLCPVFDEIGKKMGPIDLSFIPIWRGGTLGFISSLGLELNHNGMGTATHATPQDAVCIHKAVRSRNTVPVHFGTFIGAENETLEATLAFNESTEREGVGKFETTGEVKNGRAGIVNIGESIVIEIEIKKLG